MDNYYMLFNQKVKSVILLPEAVQIEPVDEVDICIELGRPPQWVIDKAQSGFQDHIEEQVMWFYLNDLVLFYVENGNHIIIYVESDQLSDLALRSYLTGSAMALAIIQKGYIPIHGGSAAYQGKGIIVSGVSGAGKSTVIFELLQQGFLFMADDMSVLNLTKEGDINVFPGFSQQKLCRDVVEKMGMNKEELIYIDEHRDKFARILKEDFITEPLQVACMIELEISEIAKKVECVEVKGVDKLYQLTNNIYRDIVYTRLKNNPERFYKLVKLAERIPMYRITRPKTGNYVPEIVQTIKELI